MSRDMIINDLKENLTKSEIQEIVNDIVDRMDSNLKDANDETADVEFEISTVNKKELKKIFDLLNDMCSEKYIDYEIEDEQTYPEGKYYYATLSRKYPDDYYFDYESEETSWATKPGQRTGKYKDRKNEDMINIHEDSKLEERVIRNLDSTGENSSGKLAIWGVKKIEDNKYKATLLKIFENINYELDEEQEIFDEMYEIDGVFTFGFNKAGKPDLLAFNPTVWREIKSSEIIFEDPKYSAALEKAFPKKKEESLAEALYGKEEKEHLDSDEDFEYDDPLNVMKKLKRTDESMENKLNKQEVLDWISEHELAWEDFRNYFVDIYLKSEDVPMDEIIGWIGDHDELAEDFEARFNAGIFTDADDYDDDMGMFDKSEYGLEESLFDKKEFAVYDKNNGDKIVSKHKTQEEASAKAQELGGLSKGFHAENIKNYNDWTKKLANDKNSEKKVKGWGLRDIKGNRFVYTFDTEDEARAKFDELADSQQMRFSVDPILESIDNKEEKWNIGSNKLISTDSQEYANLVDLAKLLQERSPNGYEYRVEKTYEDFGAGMQWYTIICDERNGWGTHQVLNTKQWLDLANGKPIEAVYQDVISNSYFQDTIEKGNTTALFNYMDDLED